MSHPRIPWRILRVYFTLNENKYFFHDFFRVDDDEEDYPSQFEADLAMMVDSEAMDVDVALGEGPEDQKTSQKWSRPDLPPINPKTDAVVFQQIDVDHYTGQPMSGMPGAQVSRWFLVVGLTYVAI